MRCLITLCFTFLLFATNAQELIQTDTPPTFPVGEDALIEWHKLPYQRLGVRAYMPSTYDRRGNNLGADGGQFLYQENDSFNVAMDVKGPGIFYFMRTNHFHGSPWHYEIDGRDLIVKETATDDPTRAKESFENTTFIPEELFPSPLVWTWTTTRGADLMWRPIPFNQRMRIAYSRTYYGTGYYIIHKFPYTPETDEARGTLAPPRKETLEVMSSAGNDQTLTLNDKQEFSGTFNLKAFEKHRIAGLTHGPAMVRGIQFVIPRSLDQPFGKCRFKVTWDHRWYESIDVPIDLFFGTGILHNPTDKEFLVKGLPITVRYDQEHVYLSCYWPMPFFDHARFEIEEKSGADLEGIRWKIITVPYTDPVNQEARVFVRKTGTANWQFAGTWYHPGSNTIIFSRPRGRAFSPDELSPTEHNIITNNRRWQEDEFLVAAQLTRGIEELEIKIEFVANDQPLFPGRPFPEPAKWSASRYWVYNYVMPYLNTDLKQGGDHKKYRKSFEELYLRR